MLINDKEIMLQAIEQLNKWSKAYEADKPLVSDQTWDELYFDLQEAEARLGFVLPNSPTQKINYEVVNGLKKIKHKENAPMLSLDKTKDIADITAKFKDKSWIIMEKCDGLSCRLIYQHGELIQASTRGNGRVGEDITHTVKVIRNVPTSIPHNGTLVVDGEVVCLDQDFKPFAQEYANSRNFAAGSIRLLDSAESAKRNLSFIAWDCIEDTETEGGLLSLQLEDLARYGFTIVDYYCSNEPVTNEVVECLKEAAKQRGLPIDGMVFKLNNKSEYYAAGQTVHHPNGACAYKFYDEEYETELLDIVYEISKLGVLTPVAVYQPVEIDGAECSRCTLHNLSVMREVLGEYPMRGQKIWVYRANQVTPQVSRAEGVGEKLGADSAYFGGDPNYIFLFPPKECPVCGAPTKKRVSDTGVIELCCTNDLCEGKLINVLEHFASKAGLDIKGLSKATLAKLIDWGWVSCKTDLFLLNDYKNAWVQKGGFGEKSVDKILAAIEGARHTTLEQYLSAIGISLIGKTYAHKLAEHFSTYEEFRTAVISGFDFSTIESFGPERHDSIVGFDYSEADKIIEMKYVEIAKKEVPLENFGNARPLQGLSFAITGSLHIMKNRDVLKTAIEAQGGRVVSSVSSKTNYLVNNDNTSNSTKNKTAKSLGIPIITEKELLNMFT